MASNYGVIGYIKPPVLSSVTKTALVKFKEEYDVYREKVADVNKSRSNGQELREASIRDCVEGQLLMALVKMGKIDGAETVEQATPKRVKKWFESQLNFAPQDLSERIDAVIASIDYKQVPGDPAGSALTYCVDITKSLSSNVAEAVLKDIDTAGKFIDKVVNKIGNTSEILKERMKMRREGWTKKEKGDFQKFGAELELLAIDVHQNEVALKRTKSKSSKKSPSNSVGRPSREDEKTYSQRNQTGEISKNRNRNQRRKRKHKEWNKVCLGPRCNKIERLKDCKSTTPEEKREIFRKMYEEKNQKGDQNKKARFESKSLNNHASKDLGRTPNQDNGRLDMLIEDKIHSVILADYGSDLNAMSNSTFEKVHKANPNILVDTFKEPVEVVGACDTNKIAYKATKSAILTITLSLPGSNIRVRIRGVKFYVVDSTMNECLMSRDLMNSMGFNFNDHLKQVHHLIHNKHADELQPEKIKTAALRYQGLSYDDADDDPIELPESLSAGIGKDSKESIDAAFKVILTNARDHGISSAGEKRLSSLLDKYRDVFRIKLCDDPPAKVSPLVITRGENAKPYRSPQRRYAPIQREFIIRTIRELEAVGAIYKNNAARWASPALAVPKPGSTKLRFTVDLRGPNARTVPIQSAMPHLESHFQDVEGSTCFANIDLAHGYWQIPLADESQEMMSIQTPLGVYSSRRLLQGGSDSGNHFQAVLGEKFQGHVKNLLQWLDDFLFYSKDEKGLLDDIEAFLQVCEQIGLKVHAEKSNFFARKVHFCGRIISKEGVQYHPRHFDSLVKMKKPTMANELQQLLCATNWMRNSIPNYSKVVSTLNDLMEKVYKKAGGKRTKRAIRKFSIIDDWGATHDRAFDAIKQQLVKSVTLSHPKQDFELCLFTDASDTHWSAILTQVPKTQRNRKIEDQEHEPLCFLSGAFKGSTYNWSVPEKEGYAIVESMCRVDYLVMGREVSMYTDHANLVQLYDPYGANPGIPRHTASKLMRWAIKLSAFRYVVEHLPGEQNVWADMLTRWAVQPNNSINSKKIRHIKTLMLAPVNPGIDESLDWPTMKDIIDSQESSNESAPEGFKKTERGWINNKGVSWIPSNDKLLQLRIIIAAHTGQGGHRSWRVTHATISPHFTWINLDKDVESFVNSCLHCLATESGTVVPRPLGHALHADKPNNIIHFDFCYMAKGDNEQIYVLIIKDDFSGYVRLIPTPEATAEVVASELISWFADFGVVTNWVSDRGTHFKNELIKSLRQKIKASHHFTLAYCPWSNGTVEVVCRELIRVTRALLSEFEMPYSSWPQVLPIVQSALNNTILYRLGNRCPLTAFTGLPQSNPVTSIKYQRKKTTTVRSISDIGRIQQDHIESLQKVMEEMHKDVKTRTQKKRQSAVNSHNKRTHVRPINFTDGDYVLRGTLQGKSGRKPSLKWHGPFRVIECRTEYIFVIEDLLTGKREEAHGRRLKFFRNSSYKITEDLKHHLAYQKGELLLIEEFTGIRRRGSSFELRAKWRGFPEEESDWTSLVSLQEDVPDLVEEYLQDLRINGTTRERQLASQI